MSLIQPGRKFQVCISLNSLYLVPGEILTIQTVAPDNTVEFLCSEQSKQRCLSISLLKHWIDSGKIVLIEEPAKPMPQTAMQVAAAMDANALQIRAAQGKALDAVGAIFGVTRGECFEDPFRDESDEEFQHRIHQVATAGTTDLHQYDLKSRLEGPEGLGLKDAHASIYRSQAAYPAFNDLVATKTPTEFEGLWPSEFAKKIAAQSEIKHKMENHPMSKVRIVDVFLFDDTPGLKAEDRLIAKYEGITTDGSDTDVIVDLALNHNIKEQLASHNEKRAKTVNEDLLNRVGKKVMLLPLEAKQIEYRIKPVVQL